MPLRLVAVESDPEQRVGARAAKRDPMRRGNLGRDVDRARLQRRAAELDQQARGDPLRAQGELGMKLLLIARRCVGAQAEQSRRAQDVGAVPGRHLQEHARGLVGDLGDQATHDPGDARGPLAIADEHGLRVEAALDPVERGHRLPFRGRADDQLAARQLVEVEGVQGLSGHQHHVVGDVDDVRDRPHPGSCQACLEPGRRWPDLDPGEGASAEARTELGNVDAHRGELFDPVAAGRLGVELPRRVRQRRSRDRMDLTRNAVDAHAIDPVRIEVELEHRRRRSAAPRRADYRPRGRPPRR